MKAQVITLTPEVAQEMLKTNFSNRKIRKNRINLYSELILSNKWKENGDSIRITKQGRFVDGQHRLMAVIKTGVPIKVVLVTDLEDDVFDTIDTGANRSAADVLSIEDIKNNTTLAAAIKKYILLKRNKVAVGNRNGMEVNITNADILNECKDNIELYKELFSTASQFYLQNYRTITKSDYIAYYRYFQSKYSDDVIDSFWEKYLAKEGVPALLFDKLLQDKVAKRKMLDNERQKLIIKAFVYFAKGKSLSLLKVAKDEVQIDLHN